MKIGKVSGGPREPEPLSQWSKKKPPRQKNFNEPQEILREVLEYVLAVMLRQYSHNTNVLVKTMNVIQPSIDITVKEIQGYVARTSLVVWNNKEKRNVIFQWLKKTNHPPL